MGTPKICGIYLMASDAGGAYIGSSRNCLERWKSHVWDIIAERSLYAENFRTSAIDGSLKFFVLQECSNKRRFHLEQKWMDWFPERVNHHKHVHSTGLVWTLELRNKISLSKKGKKLSVETRLKMSHARMGNQNALGCKGNLGKKHTSESREKIRLSWLKRPPVSEEFKQHLRSMAGNRRGAVLTLETRMKLSTAKRAAGSKSKMYTERKLF